MVVFYLRGSVLDDEISVLLCRRALFYFLFFDFRAKWSPLSSDCFVGFTSCEEKEVEHAPSIFG